MSGRSAKRRAGLTGLLHTPSRQVAGITGAIAAAMLAVFLHGQWQAYESALARAERDTHNAAFLLAEHAAQTFDGIKETLRAVARLRNDVAKGIYRSQASIHIHLKTLHGGSAILREVGWFDAYGQRVASSRQLDPTPLSIAQQPSFLAARAEAGEHLRITAPGQMARRGDGLITLSLRLEDLNGAFAGVASGTVDPEEFAKVYRSIEMGPGAVAALIHRDGSVLVHAPEGDGVVGGTIAASALLKEHVPRAATGTYHAPSPFDGAAQIASYATIPEFGLVMKVALDRRQALAAFRHELTISSATVASLLAVLLAGSHLLIVGLRRRERLQVELAAATATANEARIEAERANSAKSAFLAHMSHELRTPLNAVIGFGQILELDFSATLTADQKEYAGHIVGSGLHLLELVNDVLDLAGVESGRLTLAPEPLVAREVLAAVSDIMGPVAAKAAVTLETTETEPSPALQADSTRLRQALINLVSNAVKYNKPGGKVVLAAQARPGQRVRFAVQDTGKGIEPHRQADLFEPFRRLGAEYTSVEGTGLGLALTKRLVEAMGGAIGFTSEPGSGSRFWIELPAGPAAQHAEEPELEEDRGRSLRAAGGRR